MTLELLILVTGTFLLAGFVKGVIGLGLPTVSLALLSVALGLPSAVQLMLAPSLVTNLWQALRGRAFWNLCRRFWPLLVASFVGTWVTYGSLLISHPRRMTALLGAILVLYAANGLRNFLKLPQIRHEAIWSPMVGFVTGLLTGATGSMVLPFVPYLNALDLKRDTIVQMMGIFFTVSTLAMGVAIADHSRFQGDLVRVSVLAILPALLGMQGGQMLRARLSERAFRQCLFMGLFLVGVGLVAKGMA